MTMFSIFKNFYENNKIGLLCAVLFFVFEEVHYCEIYLLNHNSHKNEWKHYTKRNVNSTCPFHPRKTVHHPNNQGIDLYLYAGQRKLLDRLKTYAVPFSYFVSGVLSDKYGGHRVGFLGLIISGTVMAAFYSLRINSFNLVLLMWVLRKFAEGVVYPASASLIGKLGEPSQRNTSCSLLVIALALVQIVGDLSSNLMSNWMTFIYINIFMLFITSVWWWLMWNRLRDPQFIIVPSKIPWCRIFKSVYLYIMLVFYFSITLLNRMVHIYQKVKYNKTVLHTTDYKDSFVVLAMVTIGRIVLSLICGITTDYFPSKSLVPTSTTRKILLILAYITILISLILMVIAGCQLEGGLASWIINSIAVWTMRFTMIALAIDVAPTFAGTMFGLTYVLCYIIEVFLMKLSAKLIVTEYGNLRQYQILFFMWYIVSVITAIPFLLSNLGTISPNYDSQQVELPVEEAVPLDDGVASASTKK